MQLRRIMRWLALTRASPEQPKGRSLAGCAMNSIEPLCHILTID